MPFPLHCHVIMMHNSPILHLGESHRSLVFTVGLNNRPEHILEREWIKQELYFFQIKKFASYLPELFTSTLAAMQIGSSQDKRKYAAIPEPSVCV